MIKRVIISKSATFSFRIIRRINVNEFDLSAELLFQGMECDEVIAFDDKVLAYRAVFIALGCPSRLVHLRQCGVSSW